MHPHLQRLLKALRQYSQPLAAIVEVGGVEPPSKQASNKHQTTTINFKELPNVACYFCQQWHLQKAGRRIYFEHYLKPIFGRGLNLIAKPPALRNMPTVGCYLADTGCEHLHLSFNGQFSFVLKCSFKFEGQELSEILFTKTSKAKFLP